MGFEPTLSRSLQTHLYLSSLDLSLSPLRYRSDADMLRIKQYILYVGTNIHFQMLKRNNTSMHYVSQKVYPICITEPMIGALSRFLQGKGTSVILLVFFSDINKAIYHLS